MQTAAQIIEQVRARFRLARSKRAEFRFAVRVMAAGFLGFVLAGWLGLPQGYWVMLTAVIVMQNNVGGSLKAATDRLVGTLAGAFAGFLATLIAASGLVMEGAVYALVLGPLAFMAARNPSFRIAPVTAIIVVLSRSGPEPVFWLALMRVVEIVLGGVVGLTVALTVLPARAHADLGERVGQLLALLADAWRLEVSGLTEGADLARVKVQLQEVNDRIRTKFAAVETASDDADRERTARLTDSGETGALLRTLRRLRHDFILVGRATASPWPGPVAERLMPSLARVADAIATQLQAMALAAGQRNAPPHAEAVLSAIDGFGGELSRLRGDPVLNSLAPEIIGGIFTLGFALEELRREIPELGDRLGEVARH